MSGYAGDLYVRIRPEVAGFASELDQQVGKEVKQSGGGAIQQEAVAVSGLVSSQKDLVNSSAEVIAAQEGVASVAGLTARTEYNLGRAHEDVAIHAHRASIAGFQLRGSTVALGAGILVAAEAAKALSQSLIVTGNAADTVEGRFRNFAGNLLSGNIVAAIGSIGKATHDFTVAEVEAINQSPKLTKELNDLGFGASLAKGELLALQKATQLAPSAQLGVARSQAQGTPANQIASLREADRQIGRQIEEAKKLHVDQDVLDSALAALFSQRSSIRGRIASLAQQQAAIIATANQELLKVGQQVEQTLGTLQQQAQQQIADALQGIFTGGQLGILNQQAAGSSTGQISADQAFGSTLKTLLKNKKLTKDQRSQVLTQLVGVNNDIKSINAQIVQDENSALQNQIDLLKSRISSGLDRQINLLQSQLSAIQNREQARTQREALRQARKDLADAQRSVQIIGAVTPQDRRDISSFLAPFQERVRQAQVAAQESRLQSRISSLQQRETVLLAPLNRVAREGESQTQLLREIRDALRRGARSVPGSVTQSSSQTPGFGAGASAASLVGSAGHGLGGIFTG